MQTAAKDVKKKLSSLQVALFFSLPEQTLQTAVQRLWKAIELSDEIFADLESLVK